MLRRGLLTGTERLQGQLRDAAEGGQRQETEADRAQNLARTVARRAIHRVEKLAHGKKRTWAEKPGFHADTGRTRSDISTPDIQTEQVGPSDSAASESAIADAVTSNRQTSLSSQQGRERSIRERKNSVREAQSHSVAERVGADSERNHQPSQQIEQGRQKFVREKQEKATAQRRENYHVPGRTTPARQRDADNVYPRHGPTLTAQDGKRPTSNAVRGTAFNGRHSTKVVHLGIKTVGRTSCQAVKGADSPRKILRTGGRSAQAMRQASRPAVQARQRAVQAAGAARQTAVTVGRPAAKAAVSAIRGAVSAIRAALVPLTAGGGAVVAVVLVLCLVGALVMSPLGIFFSGENNGGQTISAVVREINQEYDARLDEFKVGVTYDEVSLSGSRVPWIEVLAVYAVKTTFDPTNGQDVVTMTDGKKAMLKQVFWDMNELSSFTSTVPGEGEDEEDTTTLYITVTARTADEMADVYNFTADQRQQLAELLSGEYRELWNAVLYGIGTGSNEIVAVALSQVGNVGGQPYWSWYGFNSRVDWCAIFVSWCANECGYIDAEVILRFSGCVQGSRWFKDRGLWQNKSYTPNPGDIIFFDWDDPGGYSGPQDGVPDHVGIVEKVEDDRVYTIEGNSGDKCCQRSYPLGYYEIYGYGMLCP